MCTYCGTNRYREIYENHVGPVPVDIDGKSYDIHHIDGNHDNNDPSNLKAVTIQEHYDIHASQGDWGACYFITIQRLNATPAEISKRASENATKSNQKRWQNSEWAEKQIDRIMKMRSDPADKKLKSQRMALLNNDPEYQKLALNGFKDKFNDKEWYANYCRIQKEAAAYKIKPIVVDGIEYQTVGEVCEKFNLSVGGVRQRIRSKTDRFRGWYYKTIERIPRYDINGKTYNTVHEVAEKFNCSIQTVRSRVKSELPIFKEWKYYAGPAPLVPPAEPAGGGL